MNQADYHDFYPKTLIPIGKNDRKSLISQQNFGDESFQATHWLIALQGKVKNSVDENYQWQVYLFPADIEGTYTWERPYYVSESLDSINQAIDLSCELEIYGRDDAISSSKIQEKIN